MVRTPSAKTKVMNTFNSLIRTSRPAIPESPTRARQEWLDGRKDSICYGDKIFVRVTSGHTVLLEETFTQVSDLSELTGAIRSRLLGVEGLSKVWIRNCSRGWATERPLMFYRRSRNAPTSQTDSPRYASFPIGHSRQPARHMLAPWETH